MTPVGAAGRRDARAVVLLAVALLVYSAVTDLAFGDGGYVTRNLVATVTLLVVARRLGLDSAQLGLGRPDLADGARWGAAAVGVVVSALVVGALVADRVAPVAALLADERAALPAAGVAWAVLVRIPLGTVLFEEVAFRGVLDAVAQRRWPPGRATATSAAVFGVYHVPPTMVALHLNDVAVGSAEGVATLAGAVAVTGVAGLVFSWLRRRSGSLAAPMLAHLATNVGGLLAAVAVQRGSL